MNFLLCHKDTFDRVNGRRHHRLVRISGLLLSAIFEQNSLKSDRCQNMLGGRILLNYRFKKPSTQCFLFGRKRSLN